MKTLDEYLAKFPEYAFNFDIPINEQDRVYDLLILGKLPMELNTDIEPEKTGGKGRAKRNQCRTHAQCIDCGRLLRNDCFLLPPSFRSQNRIHSYCKECFATHNADRYSNRKNLVANRRDAIWAYLAPHCAICGRSYHPAAMDMHHLGNKAENINKLMTAVTFTPNNRNIERLIAESSKCVPLCSNCHRTLHAGARELPPDTLPIKYSTWDLLYIIADIE